MPAAVDDAAAYSRSPSPSNPATAPNASLRFKERKRNENYNQIHLKLRHRVRLGSRLPGALHPQRYEVILLTHIDPGALAPLAPIFFIGCLIGFYVMVVACFVALSVWPSMLRFRLTAPESRLTLKKTVDPPTSSFEEFPNPLQATLLSPNKFEELECTCGIGKNDEQSRRFRDNDSFCLYHGPQVWRLPRRVAPPEDK